ncbi:beta-ketoacyl-ACP synthase II [Weissella diestrammenae]|uniref:3-oxoacyl-[acyl-carrier-protein] synthase 2 n=1 Tax=Weissella diestrammenae TaxID=1162633 RepID=A0A7G9T621_9LACO|nr:beta-ketoacyl-ACP synthase II [Weissella diestrammenae]MCM0582381.1 beta-ketoacyl-ACP synthase II [Weissella diestrammenae]QNN75546.1 beta-ketoacyl-ACP synthase II [Weissella diestrammenae]
MTRVVITGMGAITPLGNNVQDFLDGIYSNQVGIAPITHFDASETGITVAGEVKGYDPAERVGKREARKMDIFAQYGVHAAGEALEQAGLKDGFKNPARVGVVLGNGIGGLTTIQDNVIKMNQKGPQRVSPLFVPNGIPNMASGNVSLRYGAQGVNYTISTACASATNAIGESYLRIKHGLNDMMITGGTEGTINEIGIAGFAALTALSTATDPLQASTPFDVNRHGFVMGEGAGVLILESLAHATARGAKIIAEVVGYGANSDAYHLTSPTPDGSGPAGAMQLAIDDAQLEPADIDYVNAHGTATGANDAAEAKALALTFGPRGVLTSSTKGMTGHLLGAAGAIEAIAAIGAFEKHYLPENVGLTNQDPDTMDALLVDAENKQVDPKYVLSANYGFGGHNAAIIFKKWEN